MFDAIKPYLLVGLGSAVGGMGRLWVASLIGRRVGETFPWGTILVNISGSFLIGLLMALTGPDGRWPGVRWVQLLLVSGVCGGYTTFSAFSLQTLQLARDGQWGLAMGNVVLSVVACLGAVFLGFILGQWCNR